MSQPITNYKSITRRTYSLVAKEFAKRDRLTIAETIDVKRALKEFMRLLPRNGAVLDVGCGTGRDSAALSKSGFRVVGVDFSKKMIQFARKMNPAAAYKVMDLENLKFKEKFDGIWTNATLHHIPKLHLPAVLKKLHRLLVNEGILFIKVKHGERDSLRTNFNYGRELTRYFAYYKVSELKKFVRRAGFKIIYATTTTKREWVDIFARK